MSSPGISQSLARVGFWFEALQHKKHSCCRSHPSDVVLRCSEESFQHNCSSDRLLFVWFSRMIILCPMFDDQGAGFQSMICFHPHLRLGKDLKNHLRRLESLPFRSWESFASAVSCWILEADRRENRWKVTGAPKRKPDRLPVPSFFRGKLAVKLRGSKFQPYTLQETNISPKNGILKMIFLFPRWDMLIPWRVSYIYIYI